MSLLFQILFSLAMLAVALIRRYKWKIIMLGTIEDACLRSCCRTYFVLKTFSICEVD